MSAEQTTRPKRIRQAVEEALEQERKVQTALENDEAPASAQPAKPEYDERRDGGR